MAIAAGTSTKAPVKVAGATLREWIRGHTPDGVG
jgi:hypothetical protein